MKLLYGVQATGNGHISRARVMAPWLEKAGIEVTYLFSGRPWEQLFEMDAFGDYQWRRGLTFVTRSGRVRYVRTALHNNLPTFIRDIRSLDVSHYDLVITDFEPVTAWAARLNKVRVIGLGHQYAFNYEIPLTGDDFISRTVMKYFAPAEFGLGLHWHHFNQAILPPIIETPAEPEILRQDKILVYLPFEEIGDIVKLLARFKDFEFHVYSANMTSEKPHHVHIKQLCRAGFQNDLRDSAGVISNAGFELAGEALQMGKKLLVKPLKAQLEQLSNALALERLQLGMVMPELDAKAVGHWLSEGKFVKVAYPDVAKAIVDWLKQGDWQPDPRWIQQLWKDVSYVTLDSVRSDPAQKAAKLTQFAQR